MAPLLKILIQWLPSLPNTLSPSSHAESIAFSPMSDETNRQQQPIGLKGVEDSETHAAKIVRRQISSVSWDRGRLDVFGLAANNLTHKFWDGSQWNPTGSELETLGNGLATPPIAVTWGPNRLDVFGLDDHNVVKHQYWDGTDWRPNVAQFENLGGQCDPNYPIAANSWGPDRLDIFCRGPAADLLHQYYDGSQWQPAVGSLESLGGNLATGPSVVSWGENRLDIFAVNENDEVTHLYWDGSQWSKWENFEASVTFRSEKPTVTSWGENRLDIYTLDESGGLWHKYWDGSQWASFEFLGSPDTPLVGSVGATSWSANRIDIVGLSKSTRHYWYKYYDGEAWRPDVLGWYDKGPGDSGTSGRYFSSNPSVVSWGTNRLDIFGETVHGELLHQAWAESTWYPDAAEWECLGRCR
ncbi:MAG: hypothetical protein Q9201_004379 [Fulgogasparrea decipioides]